MCVSVEGGGGEEQEEDGSATKNENPTQRCGEKSIDRLRWSGDPDERPYNQIQQWVGPKGLKKCLRHPATDNGLPRLDLKWVSIPRSSPNSRPFDWKIRRDDQ